MTTWKNISYLEDCETLQQAKKTAKDCLSMYNEPETSFYDDLHCNQYKDDKKNKMIQQAAKNHIAQLKAFLKKQ